MHLILVVLPIHFLLAKNDDELEVEDLARSEPLSGLRAVPLPSDLKGGLTVRNLFSLSDMISDNK